MLTGPTLTSQDLAELAASRQLQTSITYSQPSAPPSQAYDPLMGLFGGQPAQASQPATATAALASLIQPSESRIGAKLMRKMGWRDGQGVGPRLSLVQRRKQAAELGVKVDDDEMEEDDGGEAAKHYYAPIDRPLTILNGVNASQDKGWGLGYVSEKGIEAGLERAGRMDDDEDDAYSSYGSAPTGARLSVVELDHRDDDFYQGGKPSSARRGKKNDRQGLSASRELFHDGQPVLPGFALASRPAPVASTSQLPPPPPPGWQPNPQMLWQDTSNLPHPTQAKGKARQLDADERGSLLGERQPGPEPEPHPPAPASEEPRTKSVFDYLSAKSKERLASFKSGNQPTLGTSTNSTPLANLRAGYAQPGGDTLSAVEHDEPLSIPHLDVVTAKAALRGFQPFGEKSTSPDPTKHARYQLFLQYAASMPAPGTPLPFGPRKLAPVDAASEGKWQTTAELNRELNEYAQGARVFKPVSGMLAGRFATAVSGSVDMPKAEPGLYQPPPKPVGVAFEGETAKAEERKLTLEEQAVKDGNFGPGTTRRVEPWRPAGLVCKRFGVPDPYKGQPATADDGPGGAWTAPGSTTARSGGGGARQGPGEALSQDSVAEMMHSAGFKRFETSAGDLPDAPLGEDVLGDVGRARTSAPSQDEINGNVGTDGGAREEQPRQTLAEVGLGDDDRQGEEVLTQKRAPKDVFSAIFAESGDEDTDDDDDDDDEDEADKAGMGQASEAISVPGVGTTVEAEVRLKPEDVASYRPTFASSASHSTEAPLKRKKDKKPSKRAALSFDFDDGDGDGPALEIKPKKRRGDKDRLKPRDKDRAREPGTSDAVERRVEAASGTVAGRAPVEDEDEGEWVEAPSVGVVAGTTARAGEVRVGTVARPARARAADLF